VTPQASQEVERRIGEAERLWLFLDYDGTLADFAPTPEHVKPQAEVVSLVADLAGLRAVRVAVISGRRLSHVEQLVPVPQVVLAGTYGVELRLPGGERVDRVSYDEVRPVLEAIKPRWERLIGDRDGFFLEDKGWALAIHAKLAADDEAEEVLDEGRRTAAIGVGKVTNSDVFRVLGGHKFLEIGPALAHKGKTVEYLLERYPWNALPLYVGDDDKDEEAFGVIHARGGIAVRVCEEPCETQADGRLDSPKEVREWLARLPGQLGEASSP
jgi:trehalose-phosphatase